MYLNLQLMFITVACITLKYDCWAAITHIANIERNSPRTRYRGDQNAMNWYVASLSDVHYLSTER